MRLAITRAIDGSPSWLSPNQIKVNKELCAILKFRHLIINVQLEFDEDFDCLMRFKTLLTKSRAGGHVIDLLNLNLGFVDSHGPEDENGLVFQKEDEELKGLVSELIGLKDARAKVAMAYTSGCICGGVDEGVIGKAIKHMMTMCRTEGIKLRRNIGYPRGWPRWFVMREPARNWAGSWVDESSRYRFLHRHCIESA